MVKDYTFSIKSRIYIWGDMFTLVPVILAGGEGRRLWPLSSEQSPKQFLPLAKNGETLFAASYRRALMVAPSRNIVIVTKQSFARQAWQEIRKIDHKSKSQAILEPSCRDTAAAISMAAIHALNHFENPVLWVMPSDHYIEKPFSLINAVHESANAAHIDKIITFGILPCGEDSSYGHMICDQELPGHHNLFGVKLFLEKPQGERLKWFAKQQNCLLNSGMFLFSAHNILKHIKTRNRTIVNAAGLAYKTAKQVKYGLMAKAEAYQHMPPLSIDKLVMEDNKSIAVRPVNIGWSGMGTWQSLMEFNQTKAPNQLPMEKFMLYTEAA